MGILDLKVGHLVLILVVGIAINWVVIYTAVKYATSEQFRVINRVRYILSELAKSVVPGYDQTSSPEAKEKALSALIAERNTLIDRMRNNEISDLKAYESESDKLDKQISKLKQEITSIENQ